MPGLAAKIRAKYPDAYTDLSDADLEAKVLAAHPEYRDLATPAPPPAPARESDSGALGVAGARGFVPIAANLTERFATNPTIPRALSTVGQITGAVGAPIAGALERGIPGAIAGAISSPAASWSGGKTGWFMGKMLQKAAAPIATGLRAVDPYLQGLSTLSGAQGALDLAQMAEPQRHDLGVLGIGPSTPHDADHPALLNDLAAKARAFVVQHLGGHD